MAEQEPIPVDAITQTLTLGTDATARERAEQVLTDALAERGRTDEPITFVDSVRARGMPGLPPTPALTAWCVLKPPVAREAPRPQLRSDGSPL